jgi:hypothetical protein
MRFLRVVLLVGLSSVAVTSTGTVLSFAPLGRSATRTFEGPAFKFTRFAVEVVIGLESLFAGRREASTE